MRASKEERSSTSDSDVSTSVDFQSASSTASSKEMGRKEDDVFETSDHDTEKNESNLTARTTTTNSSLISSSKEDVEAAWAQLPAGAKEIASQAKGILYMERYESFIVNKWPYDVKRGNLCHPRALALAGLAFHSLEPAPSAQCVVCRSIFPNLEKNSNPWILHSEQNPECCIIKFGQRDEVDDYSLDQVLEMAFTRIHNDAEFMVKDKEKQVKARLYALKKHEMSLGLQT